MDWRSIVVTYIELRADKSMIESLSRTALKHSVPPDKVLAAFHSAILGTPTTAAGHGLLDSSRRELVTHFLKLDAAEACKAGR